MSLVFAILGDPVAQVRSPDVFNRLFRERGVDAVMVPMRVPPADLERVLSGLAGVANVGGVVITVPHKQSAAALLRGASDRVRLVGAANALRPASGGWEGDLFDGEGFALGLASQGHRIAGRHFAIVGAGGAGAAISLALAERRAGSLSIWDVDRARAERLRERLSATACGPVLVAPPGAGTEVAVNATPLGMGADDELPFDVTALPKDALVAEAVMKPAVTRLLEAAAAHGCRTQAGRHMLDHQVEAVWRFFGLPR